MQLEGFVRKIFDREIPADALEWHRWTLLLPARDIDGRIVFGEVWRRVCACGHAQYKKRDLTEDEWNSLQW